MSGVQNESGIRQNQSGKVLKASARCFYMCVFYYRNYKSSTVPAEPSYHLFLEWFNTSWAAIGYRKDELVAT